MVAKGHEDDADQAFSAYSTATDPILAAELVTEINRLDEDAASMNTIGLISLISGLAMAGGGVAMLFLYPEISAPVDVTKSTSFRFEPILSPEWTGASLSFGWK